MPLFAYRCGDGHETEWFGSHSARPGTQPCQACGADAVQCLSISKHHGTAFVPPVRQPSASFRGLALHTFRCGNQHTFDDLIDFGLGEKPSDGVPCPECELVGSWIPDSKTDRSSERFPYFDRGLNLVVESKQHRRDIAENPRKFGINSDGLIPVDGDFSVDRQVSDIRSRGEANDKWYAEYEDMVENSPAYRGYRIARDQGRM